MPREFITLGPEHVGSPRLRAFDRSWRVSDFIGHIMPGDVGKRVYVVSDERGPLSLQVENDEQRAARIAATDESLYLSDGVLLAQHAQECATELVENDEQRNTRVAVRTADTCPHKPNCFMRMDEPGPCDGYNEAALAPDDSDDAAVNGGDFLDWFSATYPTQYKRYRDEFLVDHA